jgi:hypothetical protein
VVAVLLGVSDRAAVPALVGAAAGALALERFGSARLSDIAGTQSVLGEAGWHGAGGAVAATWLVTIALVLACRRPAPAAVAGALGALLVVGPALNGGIVDALVRVVAVVVGAGAGWFLAPRGAGATRQPIVALTVAGIGLAVLFGISV